MAKNYYRLPTSLPDLAAMGGLTEHETLLAIYALLRRAGGEPFEVPEGKAGALFDLLSRKDDQKQQNLSASNQMAANARWDAFRAEEQKQRHMAETKTQDTDTARKDHDAQPLPEESSAADPADDALCIPRTELSGREGAAEEDSVPSPAVPSMPDLQPGPDPQPEAVIPAASACEGELSEAAEHTTDTFETTDAKCANMPGGPEGPEGQYAAYGAVSGEKERERERGEKQKEREKNQKRKKDQKSPKEFEKEKELVSRTYTCGSDRNKLFFKNTQETTEEIPTVTKETEGYDPILAILLGSTDSPAENNREDGSPDPVSLLPEPACTEETSDPSRKAPFATSPDLPCFPADPSADLPPPEQGETADNRDPSPAEPDPEEPVRTRKGKRQKKLRDPEAGSREPRPKKKRGRKPKNRSADTRDPEAMILNGALTPEAITEALQRETHIFANGYRVGICKSRQIPTPDDVRAVCQQRGYSVNPVRFCTYYETRDWMIEGAPIRDWEAVLHSWAQHANERKAQETLSGNGG